ncbi:hypothetical protein H0H92_004517 [Tricholoma furcatifolium]|nr:hypothetical protein H0H92_004517 [Tricholoma furcatifolium]
MVISATFSPDGSHVLSVTFDGFRLFQVPSGQRVAMVPFLKAGNSTALGMFFPDGQQAVISHSTFHGVSVSNISPYTLNITNTFILKWSALSTPRGNLLVYSSSDNALYLSRLESMRFGGRLLPRDNSHVPIFSLAFSPDEQRVSAAFEDGMIILWNAEDNKLIASYQHDLALGPPTLSFVQDGSAIVVKTSTVKYLLIPTDKELIPSHNIASIQEASSMVQDSTNSIPHIYNNPPNRRLETVRWFPSTPDASGDVLWAYIGNYIIRAGKDGKFVIVPVAEVPIPH